MTSEQLNFASAIKLVKNGQSVENVATLLLACLTTEEKLSMLTGPLSFWPGLRGLMGGSMNANPYKFSDLERLGIPGVRFCDGPRGVILSKATSFPVAIARGATWDTNLEQRVGAVLAAEARALGANMCGSVCINLPRHPAWGRAQETYGEDPIHLGEFGLAMTKGLQDNGVMATAKHFALNSMEDMRFHVDVKIDDVSMHEVYLPHFEMVVREGQALSMMSAYNKVNGEWCGHHDVLLNEILRDEWDFKYFVISDWVFGIRDGVKSLKAGMDLEAPFKQMRVNQEHDLNVGNITIDEVDRSVTRILMAQLELYSKRIVLDPDKSVVYSKKHRDLAREVAAKSMVLLKNDPVPGHEAVIESTKQPLLPIDISRLTTVAMIGRLADANNSGDWGSSYVSSPHIITPYEGVKAALTAHGVDIHLTATDDIKKATIAAQQSDIAIVVVGYSAHDEGENLNASTPMSLIPFPSLGQLIKDVPLILFQQIKERLGFLSRQGPSLGGKAGGDRKSVRLPSKNIDLIRAVTKANPRTIVVMVSSGAVIVDEWINDTNTVLISWYSGCEGGDALADVLLGRVDTSGRLPFSVPKDEKDLPSFDATSTSVVYDKWFGQRLLDRNGITARFPLGYGLSYTSFTISDLRINQPSLSTSSSAHPISESFTLTVSVTNTGTRPGHHIVQVYGLPRPVPKDFPPRVLLGFAPVNLQPNETKTVIVRARTRPLMCWQSETKTWTPASKEVEVEVGSHAGDRAVWGKLKL